MKNLFKLIISVLICEAVGLLATPFTISAIDNWYKYLIKPSFSPPDWIFGPVWTILYLMMGVSFYLIWVKGKTYKKMYYSVNIFAFQLFLNFLWSVLFFGLRAPLLGFIDIIFLLTVILFNIFIFYRTSKPAAYLLIPYFLWVLFATFLNFAIVIFNP